MKKRILVTGGAGYIGSHIVRQLILAGESVIVLDNLVTGFSKAIAGSELIQADVGNINLVTAVLRENNIEAVIHLAAHTVVAESIANPLKYYENNTLKTHNLLHACALSQVKHFILSSTAAVYGDTQQEVVSEETLTAPINPYGTSKLLGEWALKEIAAMHSSLRYVALRYFNVAGAEPEGRLGQATRAATNLIKIVAEALVGKRDHVAIYGDDYPTVDGTCVRDYVHVEDIARAHILALAYLRSDGQSTTLNCGYGHGYSVKEVLSAADRIAKKKLDIRVISRRSGDPKQVIASIEKIKAVFHWAPKYDDLEFIIKTAMKWEQNPLF